MIINPFNTNKSVEKEEKNINLFNSIQEKKERYSTNNIDDIAKKAETYIILNYLEILSKLESIKTKEKVIEYIYENYKNIMEKDIELIAEKVIDKIFGYGILQKYIIDRDTTDIRVVGFNEIYLKQLGNWKKTEESFASEKEFEEYVRYCVLKNSAVINNENPIVALSDKKYNLRIEAGIKPANIKCASLVIRIHKQDNDKNLETLMVKNDMFDADVYKFLIKSVKNEKNIIICGRGGSGKTTLLRAIIDKIPKERAITSNEETAELYLKDRNIIQREVMLNRNENKRIDLEKLTKHALIMSSETIILGELKSSEANVFFDAISTGHNGYATVHADSPQNTIDRIIVLIKKDIRAQSYKEEFLRQLLASSVDYIIYMKKYKVWNISCVNYDKEENKIKCKDIIIRKQTIDEKNSYMVSEEVAFE